MSINSLDVENIGHQEKLQGDFNTFTGRVSLTELNYNLQQKHNHYVCAVKLWLISSVWVTRSTTTSLSVSQSKDWQINTHTHTSGQEAVCSQQELWRGSDLGFSFGRLEKRKLLVDAARLQRDLQRSQGTLHLPVHCRRRRFNKTCRTLEQ